MVVCAGKKILVPLTASLYVPGYLDDADKVLVDVGTGYFVEVFNHVFKCFIVVLHWSQLLSDHIVGNLINFVTWPNPGFAPCVDQ